eukprot:2344988-Rhodomonas_salina.1
MLTSLWVLGVFAWDTVGSSQQQSVIVEHQGVHASSPLQFQQVILNAFGVPICIQACNWPGVALCLRSTAVSLPS